MNEPANDTSIVTFRRDLDSPAQREQIRMVLPRHIDVDIFCRVVMTAVLSNADLAKAGRRSLWRAVMEAAGDGLLPDGREGAIVPYLVREAGGYVAAWQPMVWGLVKLVRQSGELRDLGAHVVTRADRFDYMVNEHGEHFEHHPDFEQSDAAPLLVYAYARTHDGGLYFEPMSWNEVEKFRTLSRAKADDTPWVRWPLEMGKVRVIKRLCKRLPMSTDARAVLARDDARDAKLLGFTTDDSSDDPVAAMNRTISQGNARPVPAESVPAVSATAAELPAQQDETVITGETGTPPRSRQTRARAAQRERVPAPTFAEVAEAMRQARNLDALNVAAGQISNVADQQQQGELQNLHAGLAARLDATGE